MKLRTDPITELPILRGVPRGRDFPATLGQSGIWYVCQTEGVDYSYNEQMSLTIKGNLDKYRLEKCFNRLIERHESLRTVFMLDDNGQLVQRIQQPYKIYVQEVDCSEIVDDERTVKDRVKEISLEQGQIPYDLEKGPLIRVSLVQLPKLDQRLIISFHHLVMDGTSCYNFINDWKELDKALQEARKPNLPSLPIQLVDYAMWEREYLNSAAAEPSLEYWKKKLSRFPPLLDLPYDKHWSADTLPLGAWEPISLDENLINKLNAVGKLHGASTNITLLAAFEVLLNRYTSQTDIVVASPRANRIFQEIKNITGHFTNTVILRNNLSGSKLFTQILKEVRLTSTEASYQYNLPYLMINEIARDMGKPADQPLYQVGIEYRPFLFEPFRVGSCEIGDIVFHGMGDAKFDLLFSFTQTGNGLVGHIEYNIELFKRSTVLQIFSHFKILLQSIVNTPDAPISSLGMLSNGEKKKILIDWNKTEIEYPSTSCVNQLYEQRVAIAPDAIAVACEDQYLTYSHLNLWSNQLAHYLIEQGVKPDVCVGLSVERSFDMTIGILGILKAGGAYVPLDPNYPKDRLAYMLEQANVDILLTQEKLYFYLPAHPRILALDHRADWATEDISTVQNPQLSATSEHLAYVIFTSGSTGRPKPVAMPHAALVNLIQWQVEQSSSSAGTRTLQFSSFSFDVSFQELFSTWGSGGVLVLTNEELRKDPFALWNLIQSQFIHRLFIPFIALQQFAEVYPDIIGNNKISNQPASSNALQEIFTAGEQLQITAPIRAMFRRLSHCRLYNHYGPSETHVCTALKLEGPAKEWEALPSIGIPIANNKVYVLDEFLQAVPVGVFGELYVGGAGLARGYLNREAATTERFIKNPFVNQEISQSLNNRLYKTGDIVRFRTDGTLEYRGRSDDQVKIRGFRIELGEIEQLLTEQAGIKAAVVTVFTRCTRTDGQYIAAYVTAEEGLADVNKQLRQEHLRDILQKTLPEYMVPSIFVFLDSLPLTPSGKVDRKALPVPHIDTLFKKAYKAPETLIEKTLVQIWANILALPAVRISVKDNFFELGGHSLLATRVVSQIRNKLNIELPIRELFTASTIKELAVRIERYVSHTSLPDHEVFPLTKANEREKHLLSFAQQRLLFLSQFETGHNIQYNIPWALRLEGRLSVGALERALNELLQRHESLRTVFQSEGREVYQKILHRDKLALLVIDVQTDDLSAELSANVNKVFDLNQGPLFCVRLLQLSPQVHVLLLNMHHIISDGWSIGIFNRELAALYTACEQGKPSPLLPLPIQYTDFAYWQRQWLQGEVLDKQMEYWKNHLQGAPALLTLPTDSPRPATQSFRGSNISFAIPMVLTGQLQQFSQQQGVTLFMTLLTGFYLLLARYSGQDDICVGTPIANRRRAELENLIGFFVNTLVLRSRIDTNTTVKNVLEKVRESALSAYAHQDIPFEQLVEGLKPERSLSYSPLFQVMFVLQNNADQAMSLPGIMVSTVESPYQTAKFDLTLSLVERESELGGVVEYNIDLFDETTVERFVRHYRNLLESMVRYPDRPVKQLPLLSENERQQILFDWNRTEVDYQRDLCIHQLFERQVEKTPHSVAVEIENQNLSYQALNRRSNQLAHYLTDLGVGPELRVGICIERSLEMIIGLLGILKAGGAYVPIDTEYPQQRIDYLINDSGIALVLTQANISEEKFSRHQIRTLCLDTDWNAIDSMSSVNPAAKVFLKNLIYVIYTSGSTGKPKGVMINHGSYLNHMHWMQKSFEITDKEKVLQKTSLSFDAAGWEWSLPLISGATLVIAKAEGHRDPEYLLEVIDHHQVTVFQGAPSLVNLLVDHEQSFKLHSLRYLFCGGEALSVQLCERFKAKSLSPTLCNLYGPTENTIDSTYWILDSNEILTSVPIGRPIDNVKIHLLDLSLNPVPVGVVGELCIGGAGVARGYLNRDDLTQVKFIQDPFSNHPESVLYRSGDLARYLPDGNIEFVGRMDYQVKVRGFRIELGEVESVLNLQPNIREASVVAYERQQKDNYLVAYLVCKNNGDFNQKALKATLGLKLPDYMIPSIFIVLDQLPLTHNGKVDRKALPVPNESGLLTGAYVAPRSETEKVLTGIWAEILSLPMEKIGVDSSFFDLGGHSLLATRVLSQIRKTYNIELSIRELFTSVTIRELAIKVEEYIHHSPPTDAQTFPLLPLENREQLSLSFAQQRLWFLNQLEPQHNIQYNIPWALRLEGSLSVGALEWALNTLIQRHESLRTVFQSEGGEAYQKILHRDKLTLLVVNVQADDLSAELCTNVNKVFDLNEGPLFCVKLLNLSPQVHVLLLNMHHIAADGWSIGIFNRELAALYTAYEQGKSSPLPPLPIQYADFAHWQRQWLQGEVLDKQTEYWKNHLQGAPALLTLPTDRPRPAIQSFRGSTIGFVIPMVLTGQLKKLSQQQGTTLYMTLLAGFYLLLARYSGQDDICVGTPIANRRRAELENLIGFFVNTLVLRASIGGGEIVKKFLHQVKETALLAYANQDIPFEQLVEVLNPDRNLSYSPLFQVMFVLQNAGDEKSITFPNTTTSILESEFHTSKFDLILGITESSSGLEGKLEYSTDLFDQATMERLMRHYENVLKSMVWGVDQPLRQLTFLSDTERKQLLIEWNDTKVEYPKDQCIHQLFETQVKKTPDAVAIVINDQQMTYEKLNKSSNQLAHYLISKGVKPEVRVGLCLQRSIETIIGLLGILKAGGVYIPIDSNYPKKRIEYILIDGSVKLFITQEEICKNIFNRTRIDLICMDTDRKDISFQSTCNTNISVNAENLAYVIYTSGSTGNPKGVSITHTSVIRLVINNRYLGINPEHNFLHLSSFSFDAATFEIWGALLNGCRCTLYPGKTPTIEAIDSMLEEQSISILMLTTSLFNLLVDEELKSLGKVEYILSGGEAASKDHMIRAYKNYNNSKIMNVYGPTESTTYTASYKVNKKTIDLVKVPIGKPISNTTIYVLDSTLNPIPVGVVGELYIGGDGLAREYLDRADLTASKFIPNPFTQEPGKRLYRTGDLVRYLTDGEIEYAGRIDFQVKVRGFRIELNEIENALNEIHGIRDTIVIAKNRRESKHNKYLIAYVVPEHGVTLERESVVRELKAALPEYMIPAVFIWIEALPLTSNGKVDRNALPEPSESVPITQAHQKPRTDVERALVSIWSEVLNIAEDSIGIKDSFFDLGGDSILSLQVVSRARNFNMSINTRKLFEYQTVEQLAQNTLDKIFLASQEPCTGTMSLLPIQKWFLLSNDVDPQFFVQSFLLTVPDNFSKEFMDYFIESVYIRHDALRLRFSFSKGEWMAKFETLNRKMIEDVVKVIDIDSVKDCEREKVFKKQGFLIKSSLDLEKGPLMKMVYFKAANKEKSRLLWCIHHLVVDGISWRILFEDLAKAFLQWKENKKIFLGLKSSSYQSFGQALYKYSFSPALREELAFWQTENASKSAITARSDFEALAGDLNKYTQLVTINLDKEKTDLLINKCNSIYKTQIIELLLSALVLAIKRWSGNNQVCIRMESHGRESHFEALDLSQTVGWFTSVYPLVLECTNCDDPDNPELKLLINSTKNKIRSIPRRGIGYGVLRYLTMQKEIVEAESGNCNEIVFNYLGQFDQQLGKDGVFTLARENTGSDVSRRRKRNAALVFNGMVVNSGLTFNLDYCENQFCREEMESLGVHFHESLNEIICHCQGGDRKFERNYVGVRDIPTQWLSGVFDQYTFRDFEQYAKYDRKKANNNLFLLPPDGAGLECYIKLTQLLNGCFNVCLLENIEVFVDQHFSLSSLTNYYCNLIKREQPNGPYYLGGWSRGAILSHSVANKLICEGENVEVLFLMDPIGYTMNDTTSKAIRNDCNVRKLGESEFEHLNELLHVFEYTLELGKVPYTSKVVHFKSEGDYFSIDSMAEQSNNKAHMVLNPKVAAIFNNHYSFYKDALREDIALGGLENFFPNVQVIHLKGSHLDVLRSDNLFSIADIINDQIKSTLK